MPTITHLYDTYESAAQAAAALEAAGFPHDTLSLVAGQGASAVAEPVAADAESHAASGAGTGASVGTLLGGGAGLLAGIGAMAIPGVGPVVAAGWLVATLTGAGAGAGLGGLLGALTGSGVADEHAHVYAEGVRRGSTLLSVRTDDIRAPEADAIMARFSPVDTAQRAATWRTDEGWTGFDDSRTGLSPAALQAERMRTTPTL